MKKGLLWGVALLLVLTACRGGDREAPEYMLYFLSDPQEQHGPALTGEAYSGPQGENGPTPGELLEALVAGPQTEGLASPFPRGVSLRWWEWDEERPGNLRVSMSEQYGGLADAALTLADYSIVLTLAQVQGVESVEILSEGHSVSWRSHQLLTVEEAVLAQ